MKFTLITAATALSFFNLITAQGGPKFFTIPYNKPIRVYETVRQSPDIDTSMKFTQCRTSGYEGLIVGLDSTFFGTKEDGLMPETCGKYARLTNTLNGKVVHAKITDRIWQNVGPRFASFASGKGHLPNPIPSGFGKTADKALPQIDVSPDLHVALGGRLNPDGSGINIGPEMLTGNSPVITMVICPKKGVKC